VAGGIAYLGDAESPITENGMIHSMSSIIDVIVASAGEAEYGTAFIYAQHGVWFRQIATAMGHPQPATPILCDNNLQLAWSQTQLNKKDQKVSICAFTGFAIEFVKDNSQSLTSPAPSTSPIFSQKAYQGQ
jgi:hypothetical protein